MDAAVKYMYDVRQLPEVKKVPNTNIYAIRHVVEFSNWLGRLSDGLQQKLTKEAPAGQGHSSVDNATLASPGGIDLNSSQLRLQSEGQRLGISFDPVMIASFRRGDFSGVRIQILDVVPINLGLLLGLS